MDLQSVMSLLKKNGNKKIVDSCRQHGSCGEVFGVSPANLRKLAKKIGSNHELAIELWGTGNIDARTLATMLADPDELSPSDATQWMKDVTYPPHEMEVANVIARTPYALSKMRQWRKQKSEYARTTGYAILVCMLQEDPESVDDVECRRVLKDVETEIHRSPNRARNAMVNAVIAIGIHKPDLREEAIECGKRVGDVHVDHGTSSGAMPPIETCIKRGLRKTSRATAKV